MSGEALPTHIALSLRRLSAAGEDLSADTFLMTSYLAEQAVKSIAIGVVVALRNKAPTHAYRLAYGLIRGDGLGTWEAAIRESTSEPLSTFFTPTFNPLLEWISRRRTRPEDEWFREAKRDADFVLAELQSEPASHSKQPTIRDLVVALVQIRNKTKAHGAVGPDFFAAANEAYVRATLALINSCPLFGWAWLHLSRREKGNIRAVRLRGLSPQHLLQSEANGFEVSKSGIYVVPLETTEAIFCGDLLRSDRESTSFRVPNGCYNGKGVSEFLDYSSGATSREDVAEYAAPPILPPASETQGLSELIVVGSVMTNLPAPPNFYIERFGIQKELEDRLRDSNHAIVTLHGRGGVGKTSLAIFTAHKLVQSERPRFDFIFWFSARDVDLRPSGPSFVHPDVVDLKQISTKFGNFLNEVGSEARFSELLRNMGEFSQNSALFIFDNFETMASMVELQRFLDTYTHLPNKVLITSRERAFKADYPIEVKGMEYGEAAAMLRAVSRSLNIEGLVTNEVIQGVYDHTEGHAYLMRVVLGEIQKEGTYVPPKQLVSKRIDIVNAVFERSFEKLSDAGRRVFLAVANWKSAIPVVPLVVVLGQGDLDIDAGIEECSRLSLIDREYLADGQPCYSAPLLARLFGIKKLIGDPDRLVIQEHLETLRRFGTIDPQRATLTSQIDLNKKFIEWCATEVRTSGNRKQIERIDGMLETLATLWAPAWLDLADFRKLAGANRGEIEYAFRRAVEELPDSREAAEGRARYAFQVGDASTAILSLIGAADADPTDVQFLEYVAGEVTRYISDRAGGIPPVRRGVYLASIRGHMEKVANNLDADGLSRLAWLFLLEQNMERAEFYARKGLESSPGHEHCENILRKIDAQGV